RGKPLKEERKNVVEISKPIKEEASFANATEAAVKKVQKVGEEQKEESWKKEIVKPWEIAKAPEQRPSAPEVKKEEIKKVIVSPVKPIQEIKKSPEIKVPKPEEQKEIKKFEIKIEPSFAKASEGVEKEVVKATKKVEEEKPLKKIEKKPEVKIEPPFASTSAKASVDKKASEGIEKEVVKKLEIKIEKKEEVKKPKLPRADFLAKEENTQEVQEGETIEL
ncbi:MAG: hypothetical protein NTX00_01885, partial [Candidatus Parcubacteria bacterium]|nr:hypothetical protein [Candidatus Parcubacteria bacterium]